MDVNSNICAAPLPCIASVSTRPLNFELSAGFRTTMRVVYGSPLAVPETKYSCASYLNAASPFPGASEGDESNIGPGPVTSADSVGNATAVGMSGRLAGGGGGPPARPRPPPGNCPPPCATSVDTQTVRVARAMTRVARICMMADIIRLLHVRAEAGHSV